MLLVSAAKFYMTNFNMTTSGETPNRADSSWKYCILQSMVNLTIFPKTFMILSLESPKIPNGDSSIRLFCGL